MLVLHQFPISHYCEKVRWALKYKGVEHRVNNLLPGLHSIKTRKLGTKSSVPIIVDGSKIVQGSNHIISYLDETYPQLNLTPEQNKLKSQALEWERYVDEEIGIHVRRCCYHILLEHPDIVISFFSQGGPWYGKLVLKQMFPRLKSKMLQLMKISDETARESREHLNVAVDKLHSQLEEHEFLVGDHFSRADLAAAALLAPLCRPEKYGLIWPDSIPEKMQTLCAEFENRTAWVHKLYDKFR